jgi:hypothetical protein
LVAGEKAPLAMPPEKPGKRTHGMCDGRRCVVFITHRIMTKRIANLDFGLIVADLVEL